MTVDTLEGVALWASLSHLLGTLWARTLLAPFGHGTWTAILCGAIWGFKRDARLRWDARLVGALALSIGLDAAWDWQVLPGNLHVVWLLGVGLAGLAVLGALLQRAATEEADAILTRNPELVDVDPLGAPIARANCRSCGQAAPRGAHYCPRCGRASASLDVGPRPRGHSAVSASTAERILVKPKISSKRVEDER